MELVEFNIFVHRNLINSWLRDHTMEPLTINQFPKIGYLAYLFDKPAAAGFLRKVEGGYAQLDGLIANPNLSSVERSDSIDLVVKQLLSTAKEQGITHVFSFTSNKNVLERAARHGFVPLEQSLIVANLSADGHPNPSGAV